ncbi:polyprenyl synthetase family protein [bacterium]|nr:polyprenyl synthetase family protein [bacterium]
MDIKKITYPIQKELLSFENELKKVVLSCDNFLLKDLEAFMFSSQKRLRPIFVIIFSKILQIESPLVEKIALVSELIHSASLIHDDIIDEAQTRRNQAPLYKKYNSKLAVLEGDLLLSCALLELSKTNQKIVEIFSCKIFKTIQGEIEQNSSLFKVQEVSKYLKKTFDKTGNLFLAGLESLFTLGDFESDIKNKLVKFIKNYSIAFQIKNDIKDIDLDFELGNYTLVMLYCLKDNIDKQKALERAKIKMFEYKNEALESIKNLPYCSILEDIVKITIGE